MELFDHQDKFSWPPTAIKLKEEDCPPAFLKLPTRIKWVIHGDLAARNVLLTKDKVAKISDFRLSRQLLHANSIYKKQTKVPLPWKWMALESLKSFTFTIQSDVWAFGVTLWEIFSLDDSLFPDLRFNHVFIQKIEAGFQLKRPLYASEQIYQLMEGCWDKNPSSRPDMSTLFTQIQEVNLSSKANTPEPMGSQLNCNT